MKLKDEIEKMQALSMGDQQAFESLYHFYRPMLYRAIFGWVKSHEISQEIFQDVFVSVWKQHKDIDVDKSFKSYIFKIAQNLIFDHFRKVASDRNKLEAFKVFYSQLLDNNTEETVFFKETEARLNNILDKVPEKCRHVYVLCKVEGKSYEDVSKLLNISIATVNNHIVKAKKIIKSNW